MYLCNWFGRCHWYSLALYSLPILDSLLPWPAHLLIWMASLVFIYEVSEPLVTKPFPGFGCCICPFTIQIGQGCTKRCHIGLPGCQTQFSLPPYGRIILSSSDDQGPFLLPVWWHLSSTAGILVQGAQSDQVTGVVKFNGNIMCFLFDFHFGNEEL